MTNTEGLTEQDIRDLETLGVDTPEEKKPKRTLFEVWRSIFSNLEKVRDERLDPARATAILRSWPYLKIQETPEYHEQYFALLGELRDVLLAEIDMTPEVLNAETDGVDNHEQYLNLLLQWQLLVQEWSLEWDATDANAHIRVAAMGDAQNFVLGREGLVAHFDQISFDFTDEESADLMALLDEAKVGR